jgi:hypothetical protein
MISKLALPAIALCLAAAANAQSDVRSIEEQATDRRSFVVAPEVVQDPAVLAELVNDYREEHGLARLPISPLLSQVAEAHIADMAAQPEGGLAVLETLDPQTGEMCGAHSWSTGEWTDELAWTPVCYTAGGRYANAMWAKPREITGGAYPDIAFEIATWSNLQLSPEFALELWSQSPGHRAVILQEGPWAAQDFKAMGVAIGGHFAYIWFGRIDEPAGPPK